MPTSTRLRGNEGLILTFEAEGDVTPFTAGDDVKSFEISSDDKDDSDLTFAEAASGATKEYTITVTAIVSFDATSFWTYLWDHQGDDVELVLGPKGNAIPSATKPHFGAISKVNGKPTFANEARTSQEGAEFEMEFVTDDIEKIVS